MKFVSKQFTLIIFILVCLSSSCGTPAIQGDRLSNFEVTLIITGENSIKVECHKGCDWESLSYTQDIPGQPIYVSNVGVSGQVRPFENTNFGFSIVMESGLAKLNSQRGTSWQGLSYNYRNFQPQKVDEYGMVQ